MEIKLEINGKIVYPITSLKLTKSLTSCADSFVLTLPFNQIIQKERELFTPFQFQKVKIMFEGVQVFGGYLEVVSSNIKSNSILIQGRSFTGQLIDCSLTENYSFKNTTLLQAAKIICSPFSVSVTSPFGDSGACENIFFSVTDTAFKALNYLATQAILKDAVVVLTAGSDGHLVIGKNMMKKNPVTSFIEGNGKLIECKTVFNSTTRFSKYQMFSQSEESENIEGVAIDNSIKLKRIKKNEVNGVTKQECENIASREKTLDIIDSVKINIKTDGFFDGKNNIYETGNSVTLKSDSSLIFEEREFIIQTLNFIYSKDTSVTEMSLVLPESYIKTYSEINPAVSKGRY